MRRIAVLACRCLYVLRVWHVLLALESAIGWRRQLVVLLYHHIRADDDSSLPLSEVEAGVSLSAFENQVRALRRWYQPLTSQETESVVNGEQWLKNDAMLVTFDDGYRDNRELAGHVLRKYEVPALVFIATGFIETSKRFWWIRLNDIVRGLSSESLSPAVERLTAWPEVADLLAKAGAADHQYRRRLRISLAEYLETKPDQEIDEILDALEAAGENCDETCLPILKWCEIRDMLSEGFEFGAHTISHPRLTKLTAEQVQHEMVTSKRTIEDRTGQRPTAFAYPYGDCNDDVEQAVRQARFSVSYAANPGVAVPAKTNRMRIPRVQLSASDSSQLAALVVILKLGKYLPGLVRPILSRIFGEPFEI